MYEKLLENVSLFFCEEVSLITLGHHFGQPEAISTAKEVVDELSNNWCMPTNGVIYSCCLDRA